MSFGTCIRADGLRPVRHACPCTSRSWIAGIIGLTDRPLTIFDYATAAEHARSKVFVTSSRPRRAFLAKLPVKVRSRIIPLYDHFTLIARAIGHPEDDLILVKTFSTRLLAATWPLLWPYRCRILLTIHHNLQYAFSRRHERLFLRLLARLGFRFAALECAAGICELGIEPAPGQFFVLRPPSYNCLSGGEARLPSKPVRVGVVGDIRAEKHSDDLLRMLVEARDGGALAAQLVLGCPNPAVLEKWAAVAVDAIDTSDYAAYLAALASCDVIVVNYDAGKYFYRHSGVLADAAGLGVAVVCPDFPTFRAQVTEPLPVGVLFQDSDGIVSAIQAAARLKRETPRNFEIWRRERSPQAFGQQLDAIVAAGRAGGSFRATQRV